MMKIAILSSIAWRSPPKHYGPWEQVASNVAEGLVKLGHDVTLFATQNSITAGTLSACVPIPYEESPDVNPKVSEALHISALMERASEFDIIHNHFDFLPLIFTHLIQTPIVTTIHGFSSSEILPVYQKYDPYVAYVSISDSDRSPDLHYHATVYNGINMSDFTFSDQHDDYLLFLGRIHPDKGTHDAIKIAQATNKKLIIAGIIHDQDYFDTYVQPALSDPLIQYVGSVGPEKRDQLLQRASAVLHPIYFEEPFGLSVVESMACGTPVIAYDRGSMPELIRHTETGFLVSTLEDAIDAVSRIDRISRYDCRAHVDRYFTVDVMACHYYDVYSQVLSEHRSIVSI